MTPARLLVCLDSLTAGGAERQTVELLKRLNRTSFEPRVISLHGPRMNLSRHFVAELESSGVPVVELDRRWHWREVPGAIRQIATAIREFRPAIVHSINHHSNHLTRASRLLPGPAFQLLTAIRTDYNPRQLHLEWIEQRLSDVIVCNSPPMLAKLRSIARIPDGRLRYIPNGLDVRRFSRNPDPGLRQRLAPGKRRVVTMLARITEQKSPHLLALAVAELRRSSRLSNDVVIWIVGDRDSAEIQAQLDAAIHDHGLADVVQQFPATDQPAAYHHASDFTVLASLWEGTPNSVLESLAAGRPVLVSAAANAAGLIHPGVHGWEVPTRDVTALAAGLAQALNLPDTALAAMAAACQSRAAEFDLDSMVSRYEALYSQLLGAA